jgi:hypothetical protein
MDALASGGTLTGAKELWATSTPFHDDLDLDAVTASNPRRHPPRHSIRAAFGRGLVAEFEVMVMRLSWRH